MPETDTEYSHSAATTRSQLIAAAEKLFAESGIDAVSLRQINVAAGQKNSSAAHYHFGSKAALILAIYDKRMASVNARREHMLDELARDGRQHDVRCLIEALLSPIVAEIAADASGNHYIGFLAQAMGHPQLDMAQIQTKQHASGLSRIVQYLREALPQLPPRILSQRFGLSFELIIHSLSDRQRLGKRSGDFGTADADLFVANLVDFLSGAMTAPISSTSQQELRRADRNAR